MQRKDWLAALGYFLHGTVDYVGQLQAMLDGRTVSLAGRRVGSTRNMLRETRQRVIQIGYGRLSLSRRIVEGLVPGSQADQAGLRNGDAIIKTASVYDVAQDPLAKYYMLVERGGKQLRFEWDPREDREVSCWMLESFKEDIIPAAFIR